jgi:hypothetical protein
MKDTCFGIPIAPGLYEIGGEAFRPDVLKNGSADEQLRQRMNWRFGTGSSVYIGWVPDELLPTIDKHAEQFFGKFGKINRIEFVPKYNADRKQIGHMAFVHFDTFYVTSKFAENVANAYPAPYEVNWSCTNRFGKRKDYILKCCINVAPIPKVEYNSSQLTDMFERLNTRVMTQMDDMKRQIAELQAENAAIMEQLRMAKNELAVKDFEEKMSEGAL